MSAIAKMGGEAVKDRSLRSTLRWCWQDWAFLGLLAGFLFCVTCAKGLGMSWVLYLGYVFVSLLVVLVGYDWMKKGRGVPADVGVFWCFCGWAIGTGFLVCVNRSVFFSGVERLLQSAIILTVVSIYSSIRRSPAPVFGAILLFSLILVLYVQSTGGFRVASELIDRGNRMKGFSAKGLVSNSNLLGLICLWGLMAIAWFWGQFQSALPRVLLGVAGFGLFAGIVFSASRKAFIVAVIFLVFYLLICYRQVYTRNFLRMVQLLFLLAGSILLAAIYLPKTYVWYRIEAAAGGGSNHLGDGVRDNSSVSRIELLNEGVWITMQNPLFGVGLSQFQEHSFQRRYSHSNYVEISSNTGVIGLLIYLWIYVILLGRLRKLLASRHLSKVDRFTVEMFMVAFLCYIVVGVLQVQYLYFTSIVLLGCMIGSSHGLSERERSKDRWMRRRGKGGVSRVAFRKRIE